MVKISQYSSKSKSCGLKIRPFTFNNNYLIIKPKQISLFCGYNNKNQIKTKFSTLNIVTPETCQKT